MDKEEMNQEQKRFEEILESIRQRMTADALRGNPVGRKTYGQSPNVDSNSQLYSQTHYISEHS